MTKTKRRIRPTMIPAAETLAEALPSFIAAALSSAFGDVDFSCAITTTTALSKTETNTFCLSATQRFVCM